MVKATHFLSKNFYQEVQQVQQVVELDQKHSILKILVDHELLQIWPLIYQTLYKTISMSMLKI